MGLGFADTIRPWSCDGDGDRGRPGERLLVIGVVVEGHPDLDGLAHIVIGHLLDRVGRALNIRVVRHSLLRKCSVCPRPV